jgi:hypothetical protein
MSGASREILLAIEDSGSGALKPPPLRHHAAALHHRFLVFSQAEPHRVLHCSLRVLPTLLS